MPLIAPAQVEQTERKTFRLRKELIGKIGAYASMIHSPEEHVISGALDRFFSSDKDFQKYLADNPSTITDVPNGKKRRGRPNKIMSAETVAAA